MITIIWGPSDGKVIYEVARSRDKIGSRALFGPPFLDLSWLQHCHDDGLAIAFGSSTIFKYYLMPLFGSSRYSLDSKWTVDIVARPCRLLAC